MTDYYAQAATPVVMGTSARLVYVTARENIFKSSYLEHQASASSIVPH